MRKVAVIVLRCVVAAALCGAPQVLFAQNSTEQQKEKKEQKQEKKAMEQKKKSDKAKKKSDSRAEVNRIYDSFKKSEEPVKKEAGSLRKSLNDAFDKLK